MKLEDIRVGDTLICYTRQSQVGGMGWQQNYMTIGHRYEVMEAHGVNCPTELYIMIDRGDFSRLYQWLDYLCTPAEYRAKKITRILQ